MVAAAKDRDCLGETAERVNTLFKPLQRWGYFLFTALQTIPLLTCLGSQTKKLPSAKNKKKKEKTKHLESRKATAVMSDFCVEWTDKIMYTVYVYYM